MKSKYQTFTFLFTFLVLQLWTVASASEEAPSRRPASIFSDAAKHLSSAYVGFYHRHDSSGCIHTGFAIAALPSASLTAEQASQVREKLTLAKEYCTDDRVNRSQAIRGIRDSIKIMNGHSLVNVD